MTTDSKMYYPYANVTIANGSSFLAYTGTPVAVEPGSDAPESTSAWPPCTTSKGFLNYFDGIGWVVGPDVTTMTLKSLQALALTKANAEFQAMVDTLSSGYPSNEQQSWTQQLADAQAVLSGADASPLLMTLAIARSTSVTVLAQKIVDKNAAWTQAYATALASLQKTRTAIEAATRIADLPPFTIQDLALR